MDAFRCDRCGEYGLSGKKQTLSGTIVRGAIDLYKGYCLPGPLVTDSFTIYQHRVYADSLDLCPGCADLLGLALKEWWTPGETMVEFESIEDLVESFGE